MLIPSERISPQDLSVWEERVRYDAVLGASTSMRERTSRAHQTINDFAAGGCCYASVSWGKDSTVLAHLVVTSGAKIPLVYVRMRGWENPDCLLVRDRFLGEYKADYHEFFVDGGMRWWDDPDDSSPDFSQKHSKTVRKQFAEAEKMFGTRHISGVRAEESKTRRIAQARWGDAGPSACRPLGRWKAVEIFAYLHLHDLPVHPAYAMSWGGALDRCWIRVSPIGGISSAHRQRADWEQHYYPDIVRGGAWQESAQLNHRFGPARTS